jgi:hypothetical protein
MASSTTSVKRDPYADLPRVPDFPSGTTLAGAGEARPRLAVTCGGGVCGARARGPAASRSALSGLLSSAAPW